MNKAHLSARMAEGFVLSSGEHSVADLEVLEQRPWQT
jgi:hypothetical protein